MTVEAALIMLGTSAVRTATKLWLGNHQVAAEAGSSAVDYLSQQLSSHRDKRKLNRLLENFADSVVDRLEPILEREFRGLAENERLAAVDAVQSTLDNAVFLEAELFAADLDAGHLDKSVRGRSSDPTALLSADGRSLYDLLLRECCGYVIEISRGLPEFSNAVLVELLRRDTQILEEIREVLSRLPQRDRGDGFEYDYRQLVARKLDQVEIFGITLANDTRRYPLSVSYISLTASTGNGSSRATFRIEDLLAGRRRLFIRGEAGLGKTTLLQWIAVRSARGDFTHQLRDWNRTVPFFLPLRRYSDGPLPTPERFMDEVGRHIVEQMPKVWIHEQLRSGRAIVLVDGVDEFPIGRREEARAWLNDLVTTFSRARFVVTSRPGAPSDNWLREIDFPVVDLEQMNQTDVRTFVGRWHDAIRSLCVDDVSRAEIDSYEKGLVQQLGSSGYLRKLAGYPLLCALLCALYKDRRAALPTNRLELYDVALQMLLERRDAERKIPPPKGLDRIEKILLLGDLAYWLIRNARTDIETDRAIAQLGRRLALMPQIQAEPIAVYRHLLERSGLLRESVTGRTDFIHRTFQEYLAARTAIMNADDVGQLIAHAHFDQWHEVVIMAAGHASFNQREELLNGLLSRAGENEGDALALLAVACLETTPELGTDLRQRIERRVEALLPPKSLSAARVFGSAGEFVLDLLAKAQPRTTRETVATIRALAETGLAAAIPIIARYCSDDRVDVREEVIRSSARFDDEAYATSVLARLPVMERVDVDSEVKMSALKHLPLAEYVTIRPSPHLPFGIDLLPPHVESVRVEAVEANDEYTIAIGDEPPLSKVRRVEIEGANARGLEHVRRLTSVQELDLSGISVTQLEPVAPGWQLTGLSLTYVRDLVDLAPLAFVDRLESLTLEECPRLRSLDGIERWSGHLVELALRSSRGIDFDAIGSATRLRHLDLTDTRVPDVTVLFGLKNLRKLELTTDDPRDVTVLRHELPTLSVTLLPPSRSHWSG
ncbi:NACHT domain-containing protein [Actinophytocola xanthii]|uniref:NACHT domain-containing protein n=1 Tax=Actinophytocola xanthii TaxID=1912961 RepID=A0A1Q8CPG8_9PSEU|nr:NACHT domain-containing protein [Actinophytocola xanthii]OLF16241.1 hypothetical protein BU204_17895 [Actinophytocola xanthii]